VEHGFGERFGGGVKALQHSPGDSQRIAAGFRIKAPGGALQALANFADGGFIDRLAEFLFLLAAKFDQVIDQLGLAARLPRNFQAAQRRGLNIEIAHFPSAFANTAQ